MISFQFAVPFSNSFREFQRLFSQRFKDKVKPKYTHIQNLTYRKKEDSSLNSEPDKILQGAVAEGGGHPEGDTVNQHKTKRK